MNRRGVDGIPDLQRGVGGLFAVQTGVAMKVRFRTLENRPLKCQKAVDVPLLDVGFIRVDVDGEIEKIRDKRQRRGALAAMPGLENV